MKWGMQWPGMNCGEQVDRGGGGVEVGLIFV